MARNECRREGGVDGMNFPVYTTDVFNDLRVRQSIKARWKTAPQAFTGPIAAFITSRRKQVQTYKNSGSEIFNWFLNRYFSSWNVRQEGSLLRLTRNRGLFQTPE